MTAKRFELRLCNNGIYYLWDNNELTDIDFDQFNKESANGIVDLLNELAEENEQLKTKNFAYLQDIEVFKEENTHLKLENEWLKSIHFANDVLKENKELKQSNERLLKMLDNVANYMQKQNKYMPIDDFVEWWNGIATKGLDDGDVE